MKHNGKIYAYVGVIGSGKSYRANKQFKESLAKGVPVLMSDFSDGIRDTCLKLFGCGDGSIDLTSYEYNSWKNVVQHFDLPIGNSIRRVSVCGREILKRIGEGMKQFAGNDVWAKWSANDVVSRYFKLNEKEQDQCDVIFGSVRFGVEVQAVLHVAHLLKKEVVFIFCNYQSELYQVTDHISERFACEFIKNGFSDGDDITSVILEKFQAKPAESN